MLLDEEKIMAVSTKTTFIVIGMGRATVRTDHMYHT
jgi:hypothetical protein